jgi:2-amino-4-hydroxy-6-hydroxymethyldihydropteridine diphosphokinase
MKKYISPTLVLFKSNFFPFSSLKKNNKPHTVTLGIGGNIGNVKIMFHKLFLALKGDKRFDIIRTSPILQNPPFGYLKQDDFFNAIIIIKTYLSPIQLLNETQRYEKRFKRIKSFQYAPRTLDIDILFYDKIKFKHSRLIIPHKSWLYRKSVIIPLKYIKDI